MVVFFLAKFSDHAIDARKEATVYVGTCAGGACSDV
jgi:hypothetical protein